MRTSAIFQEYEEINSYVFNLRGPRRILAATVEYIVIEEEYEPLAGYEERRMRVVRKPDGSIVFIGDYEFAMGEEAEALAYARAKYGSS